MRKKFIAGNWKMNMTATEAKSLVLELVSLIKGCDCDIVICPPAIDIPVVWGLVSSTNIMLGAQNIHWEKSGAYTGEISADMLTEFGVKYSIIGHSERRAYFGETDETVNKRAKAALQNCITPIICVGESLSQRESGETNCFVTGQIKAALNNMTKDEVQKIIIAYEPIWAIGTGKTATSTEANETIGVIRKAIADIFDCDTANAVRILYGGSMNDKNAQELLSMPEIDGGLIGGASLKSDKFAAICKAGSTK